MRQASPHVPDERIRELHDFGRYPGAVHDFAGHDEKRHSHESEEIKALEKPLGRHGEEIFSAHLDKTGHPGHPQDIADRQADQNQAEKNECDDNHETFTSARGGKSRSMVTISCMDVRAPHMGTDANGTTMFIPKMVANWVLPLAAMPIP